MGRGVRQMSMFVHIGGRGVCQMSGDRTVWCWTIWCRTIRCGQFGVGQLGAGQLGAGQLGAMDNLVWGPNWTIRCRTIRCRTIRCDGQLGATISVEVSHFNFGQNLHLTWTISGCKTGSRGKWVNLTKNLLNIQKIY